MARKGPDGAEYRTRFSISRKSKPSWSIKKEKMEYYRTK